MSPGLLHRWALPRSARVRADRGDGGDNGLLLLRRQALAGRIADDGVWSSVDGGGGGALPFQDVGWKKLGHFVAAWPAGTWASLTARDATGRDLETYSARQR